MAIRIRVYPQGGYGGYGGYGAMGGLGGYGMYGGRVAQMQLQNERKTGNLRLQYERALWAEKLKTVQLETAMQYGAGSYGAYGGYGRPAMPFGGLGASWMGGMGLGLGTLGSPLFGALGLGSLF